MESMKLFFLIWVLFIPQLLLAGDPITYCTDLEGNWDKFQNFLKDNPAFYQSGDGKFHLKRNHTFVFGGDAPDRENGSMRIVNELLRLKREAGDHVVLILGNRDLNKVQLVSRVKNNDPDELKRILADEMGSPKAFEFHRQEMALLNHVDPATLSDKAVAVDYLTWVGLDGKFTEFLSKGQLLYRSDKTFFSHSILSDQNFGKTPGLAPQRLADRWVSELNDWYRQTLKNWKNNPTDMTLVDYSKLKPPLRDNPESVVYGGNYDAYKNPLLPSDKLIQLLQSQGIERAVAGHKPMDQVPVIRRKGNHFELVHMDNSYARNETFPNRLSISGEQGKNLRIDARTAGLADLPEKINISTELGKPTVVGSLQEDGKIVVAQIGDKYLSVRFGENYLYDRKLTTAAELTCPLEKLTERTLSKALP
jgi:hypothetical protein